MDCYPVGTHGAVGYLCESMDCIDRLESFSRSCLSYLSRISRRKGSGHCFRYLSCHITACGLDRISSLRGPRLEMEVYLSRVHILCNHHPYSSCLLSERFPGIFCPQRHHCRPDPLSPSIQYRSASAGTGKQMEDLIGFGIGERGLRNKLRMEERRDSEV